VPIKAAGARESRLECNGRATGIATVQRTAVGVRALLDRGSVSDGRGHSGLREKEEGGKNKLTHTNYTKVYLAGEARV
jgi:hypothetical protein